MQVATCRWRTDSRACWVSDLHDGGIHSLVIVNFILLDCWALLLCWCFCTQHVSVLLIWWLTLCRPPDRIQGLMLLSLAATCTHMYP